MRTNPNAMHWKDWKLSGIALIALVATTAVAQESATLDYDYRERSTGVIEVHFLSSTSLETVQFIVYGDGRVHGKVVSTGAGKDVLEEFDRQLGQERVSDMVDDTVRSGLVDFEPSRFVRSIRDRGEPVPHVVDGSAVFFEIRLDFLARGAEASETPVSHSFVLDFPDEYLRRYPETPELRALQRIKQVLEEIYWSRRRQP